MELSVVVASHNQKERLSLVLHGLMLQTFDEGCYEVVVVDDECTDGTDSMLASFPLPNLRIIRQRPNRGRCAARNLGIDAALGDLVVFLDGDALPAPRLLEAYAEANARYKGESVLCGLQYCLPDMEYFQDPSTGELFDLPLSSVLCDYLETHRERMVVTADMVRDDFGSIHRMSKKGACGYPVDSPSYNML